MTAVVADTHVVFWHLSEPHLLSVNARNAFSQAISAGDPIYVASITIVESRYLVERGRIAVDALDRLLTALTDPHNALVLVPLDLRIALAVGQIPRADVPDTPDRIIAATALHLGVPLVTRDHRIRAAQVPTIW